MYIYIYICMYIYIYIYINIHITIMIIMIRYYHMDPWCAARKVSAGSGALLRTVLYYSILHYIISYIYIYIHISLSLYLSLSLYIHIYIYIFICHDTTNNNKNDNDMTDAVLVRLNPKSLASRRGRDKRGFHRGATNPLHVAIWYF